MPNNIYRFRTIKHGGPQKKFKMLPDRPRRMRKFLAFFAVVIVCGALAFALVTLQ